MITKFEQIKKLLEDHGIEYRVDHHTGTLLAKAEYVDTTVPTSQRKVKLKEEVLPWDIEAVKRWLGY